MLKLTKQARRQLAIENASYPAHLVEIPRERWIAKSWDDSKRVEVWRSRHFLVQIFAEVEGAQRMTVSRTEVLRNGDWQEYITWDDLQDLKRQCGRSDKWAVEIFPAETDLVNVANMRHLWVLSEAPRFAWVKGAPRFSDAIAKN